ncbi:putative DNA-binding WGR domain protein [Rhizobium rosettiformans]|nr:putative DNA-binding WGR domain protein [Rhizobium rosettiformans]MDR7066874.1 putative DNA-binding WGR domain protein [Rhizobium rosettiformans]
MNQSRGIDSWKSLDAASKRSENPGMQNEETGPVHLHRIDAAQNMHRFYTLAIQPTLFGGASVIRNWGRIGSNGQTMMETFDSQEDADTALSRLERTKRKRGYRNVRCAK